MPERVSAAEPGKAAGATAPPLRRSSLSSRVPRPPESDSEQAPDPRAEIGTDSFKRFEFFSHSLSIDFQPILFFLDFFVFLLFEINKKLKFQQQFVFCLPHRSRIKFLNVTFHQIFRVLKYFKKIIKSI